MSGLGELRWLGLWNTRLSDASLEHLAGLRSLRVLDLTATGIDGSGLVHLAELDRLAVLAFGGNPLRDDTVRALAELEGLKTVDLSSASGLGDATVEHVRSITGLVSIGLAGTGVTDRGLARLAGHPSLRNLDLTGTAVSPAAVEAFTQATPACRVVY